MSGLIVASLGTDHHPFDRLVGWLDALAADLGADRVLVQHGHSVAPAVAGGRPFVPHAELLDLMVRAEVVVCHGGPGTLMDARHAGHVPVLVPRDPRHGEHVDHHQQRFAAAVRDGGLAEVAEDRSTLDRLVHARLATTPARREARTATIAEPAGLHALVAELDQLPAHPHRRTPMLRSVRRAVQR